MHRLKPLPPMLNTQGKCPDDEHRAEYQHRHRQAPRLGLIPLQASSLMLLRMALHRQSLSMDQVTTTLLINNIHCASCLSYIQEVLSTLKPAPLSITANYVSHEVVIIHFAEQSANNISQALSDAAFEVQSVRTEDGFGCIIYEQDEVQAHQQWLEQAAQTLSEQASTLSWLQTTAYTVRLGDATHQLKESI